MRLLPLFLPFFFDCPEIVFHISVVDGLNSPDMNNTSGEEGVISYNLKFCNNAGSAK